MNFSDDEYSDHGFSFADIGRSQARKTQELLNDLEKQLYSPEKTVEESGATINEDDADGDEANNAKAKYCSFGYDAHTDSVSPDEIKIWKRSFAYLRVGGDSSTTEIAKSSSGRAEEDGEGSDQTTGVEYVPAPDNTSICDDKKTESGKGEIPSGQHEDLSSALMITAATMSYRSSSSTPSTIMQESNAAEEILYADGILEEPMCVDSSGTLPERKGASAHCDSIPTPSETIQSELVSRVFDIVWPEVVKKLNPLVRKVVQKSRETGLAYEPQQSETNDRDDEEDGGFAGGGEVMIW
jgi:hypothetical protein